jgi:hypothetical protein
MAKATSFTALFRKALKKQWATPPVREITEDNQQSWIDYWEAMGRYARGEQEGRPIPPHRSGGGMTYTGQSLDKGRG